MPRTLSRRSPAFAVLAGFLLLLATCPLLAQLPATRLGSVVPSGGTPGSTFDVTIGGEDLDDVASLHFSHPAIAAKPKTAEPGPFDQGPQVVPNQFVVTVPAGTPLGVYEVRAQGKYGLSNPRAFAVGDVPETIEAEPNDAVASANAVTAPVVVNGISDRNGDVDYFKFTATAGQRILALALGRHADSRMDPVVAVFDAAGRELGSHRGHQGRNALVDLTAPANGEYTVRIHDSVYQGGRDYFYRLSIGALPYLDCVLPLAGAAGSSGPFTLLGRNLPGGQPTGLSVDGRPLEKLSVGIPIPGGPAPNNSNVDTLVAPPGGGLDFVEYRVKGPQGSSNALLVGVATAPPVAEQEPNDAPAQAQKVALPCEVMGQFYPQRDRDWFQFEAKKGELLTIEVISQRQGMVTSPSLLVQQVLPGQNGQPEQLQQLAYVYESGNLDSGSEFDTRTDDPAFSFTVPADGTYRVLVRDSISDVRADPRQVYRLAIRRAQPDFRLVATPERSYAAMLLRKGDQAAIRVVAFRKDGFDGEIRLTPTGLPAGVTASEAVIGPGRSTTMLILTAAAAAPPGTGFLQVAGTAQVAGAAVTRQARFGASSSPPQPNMQPPVAGDGRVVDNLAVCVSAGETAPVAIQAGGGKVRETPRAGIVKIPFTRVGPFAGRLVLTPQDLPPNIGVPQLVINPGANSGEQEFRLQANTPTGTYTVVFNGTAEQVDYKRNPEAAAAAAEKKKKVDQIKTEADAAAKVAADAKAAADRAATETANAVQAATSAKAAADQALAQANTAATAAAAQATSAKSAATANPNDTNLAAAATAAQKAADDAAAAVKVAMTNVANAQKVLDDANVKAKAAADAKATADKKAAEADARGKLAGELKAATDKLAADLAAAANPQKRNIPVISTPFTLKITPAPITLAANSPATPLKQGEKLDVPVSIARLYSYNDAVNISATLPPGVAGLSISNVNIAAGQAQAVLNIAAAADATPGQHTITVRASLNLNGQNLTLDQPITVNVQPVPKPAGS